MLNSDGGTGDQSAATAGAKHLSRGGINLFYDFQTQRTLASYDPRIVVWLDQ